MTFTTRPTLQGTFGMVSSTHWLASQSAMARCWSSAATPSTRRSTAGFVLHVVEPHLNGPGGEVPAIVATADGPGARACCAARAPPRPARPSSTTARSASTWSPAPARSPPPSRARSTPGCCCCATTAPGRCADVLAPAIGYAARRAPAAPSASARRSRRVRELFERATGPRRPSCGSRTARRRGRGAVPQPGVRRRPRAARRRGRRPPAPTASARSTRARRAWSAGLRRRGGRRLLAACRSATPAATRTPACHRRRHGRAGPPPGRSRPRYDWPGSRSPRPAPWGQGPVLLQTLAMLDALDDPAAARPVDGATASTRIAEVLKLAFADREAWYGDGADVPLDDAALPGVRRRSGRRSSGDQASRELRPGQPGRARARGSPATSRAGARGPAAPARGRRRAGEPTVAPDGAPGATPATSTSSTAGATWSRPRPSGGWLQSSPAIPELGFPLGSRLQMFWLEEGLPSSLAPGRRPRTTLTPDPGAPRRRAGARLRHPRRRPAGPVAAAVPAAAPRRRPDLQEAIDAPMWHTDQLPGLVLPARRCEPAVLVVEDRLGDGRRRGAAAPRPRRRRPAPWTLGRLCAVSRDPETGVLPAGANPRGCRATPSGADRARPCP